MLANVAQRVAALAAAEFDRKFEHPHDVALSAYLMVLSEKADPEMVAKAAAAVATAPNLWWSAGIAFELVAHAVAMGCVKTQLPSIGDLASILVKSEEREDWRKALWGGVQKLWTASEFPFSTQTSTVRELLAALRSGEVKGQVAAREVITSSPPPEDGARVVWRPRRSRRVGRVNMPPSMREVPNRRREMVRV